MKIHTTNHLAWLAALTLGAAIALPAQLAQAQATAPATDEIVQMPTFSVITDRDIGYVAVDSFAGGRVSVPIRLTPSAMSSLTSEFISDLGVTDMRQALQWTLNVIPGDLQAGKGSPFNAWDYNFRGAGQSIQGGAGPTRNYFTFYQVADAYNVDRIEFDRGPNSILFGVGTVGGVLNIYTKQPRLDRNFVTPEVTVDNNGTIRGTIDANYRVRDNVAIRVNAVASDRRGWRKNDSNRFLAANIGALWKITNNTQARLDLEAGEARNTILQSAVADGLSQWDGTTIAATSTTTLNAPGVASGGGWNGNVYPVFIPSNPGLGVQDFMHAYYTQGHYLPLAPYAGFYKGPLYAPWVGSGATPYNPPTAPSRDWTVGSGISRPEYATITATLDQKITTQLDAELTFYRYWDYQRATNYENVGNWAIDINKQLPNGAPNPEFGQAFGDFFLSKQTQQRGVTEGRAQLNYHFDAGPLKERISVAGGTQEITWNADQYLAQWTNNPATAGKPYADTWTTNMVWARLYADNPNISFTTPTNIGGKTIAYTPPATDWFNFDEVHRLSNIAAVSHTRLWDDTLSILAGVRYDSYTYNRTQHYSKAHTEMKASKATYALGAIYYIPAINWLGLFANYSTNFDPLQPGLSNKLDGSTMTAATGRGTDFGLRISTKDAKYYASLSYYTGRSAGRSANTILGFSNYWQNYYKALQQPADTALTTLNYSDTEALKLHGWEFDATANPLPSLRIQASFALPKAEYGDALPGQRAYFASHLAQWQQAVTTGLASGDATAIAAAAALQSQLTNGANTLDSAQSGRPQINTVDYTGNLFANYTFLNGDLKGFSVGAGGTLLGKQYITTIRDQKWHAAARGYASMVLAYTTKRWVHNKETRIALNIDNVFNNRKAVITSFDGGWRYADGTPAPNGYYQPTPITFTLSARITF